LIKRKRKADYPEQLVMEWHLRGVFNKIIIIKLTIMYKYYYD